MDSFSVFEEHTNEAKGICSEFACQTEEIAFAETDVQTIEEAVVNNENLECDAENDPELGYWKTVVANRRADIKRIKEMNDKMEREKTMKTTELEEKQAEYTRLFDLGNEKLNKSKEDENEDEEEEDEEEDTK